MSVSNQCGEGVVFADDVLRPSPQGLSTSLVQQAIDAASARGGGRVVLSPGVYHCGALVLRSNVTLHLERGARILGSPDLAHYVRKEGEATALIFADGAKNIAITGEGIIDGNGVSFRSRRTQVPDWVEEKKRCGVWIPGFETATRPRTLALILLSECRNVRLEGVRVQDSTRWTIHFFACHDVTVRGVVIRNVAEVPNGDGIDIDSCSGVLIEDCDIETADDAICLKTTRLWGVTQDCRDITVRRCRLMTTCHGFCIGHETQDDFINVSVSEVQIGGMGGYPVLTGIGLGSIDGAALRNIRLSRIDMDNVVAPFQIRLSSECKSYRGHTAAAAYRDKKFKQWPIGELCDIALEDINVHGAGGNSFISGLPGHPLHNLSFRRVSIHCAGPVETSRVLWDVPELESEYPSSPMWRYLPAHGLFLRHIAGLQLENVAISHEAAERRPGLLMKDVSAVTASEVQSR